ncbi:MAG: DUF58 domain-containing protein [Planctomycetota bacterium]
MNLRPGPTLIRFFWGGVAVGLASFVWGAVSWLLLPGLLYAGILAIQDYRRLRARETAVALRRKIPARAGRDKAFPVALHLVNTTSHSLQGELRDELPAAAEPAFWTVPLNLAPGEERDFSYALRLPLRGLSAIGPLWVRLRGPLGMWERQAPVGLPQEVKVYPESAVTTDEELRKKVRREKRFFETSRQMRLRGEGMEFESLVNYQEGDDPRHIDWRASAHQGLLMVRRFQIEHHRNVMILVDCGRLMGTEAGTGTKLDRAVDSALMLCRVALDEGDRCGLSLFDDRVRGYLPPQLGPRAYSVVLETLYNAQSCMRETNFGAMFAMLQQRHPKRALVVVLSDLVDAETTDRFRGALATLSQRHVVLFAALQTPYLMEVCREPIASSRDVARKATAMRLLRDREKALHSLRRSGVFVLDVPPDKVTVPLINEYIAIRGRNLL